MLRTLTALAALLISSLTACAAVADTPITVRTDAGAVVGREANNIDVFKGVPFAAATGGPGRWRPPRAPQSWARRSTSRMTARLESA